MSNTVLLEKTLANVHLVDDTRSKPQGNFMNANVTEASFKSCLSLFQSLILYCTFTPLFFLSVYVFLFNFPSVHGHQVVFSGRKTHKLFSVGTEMLFGIHTGSDHRCDVHSEPQNREAQNHRGPPGMSCHNPSSSPVWHCWIQASRNSMCFFLFFFKQPISDQI